MNDLTIGEKIDKDLCMGIKSIGIIEDSKATSKGKQVMSVKVRGENKMHQFVKD